MPIAFAPRPNGIFLIKGETKQVGILDSWYPSIDWETLRRELAELLERFGLDQSLFRASYEPTEDEIRKRAYEIYLARHGGPGSELDDWLKAQAELKEAHRLL